MQSTRSPTPINEPTHDSLALGWQDWVLSGLWSLPSRAAPRFGLKRSFQSLLLDGTWNPGQKFSFLPLPCQGPSTRPTELAISARLHELPSLNSVTWRKARHSIGCDLGNGRCLFPHGPLSTVPDTLRHSQLSYVPATRPCATESSEDQQSFLDSPSTPFQHTPTSLQSGSFNANITGAKFTGPDGTDVPLNFRPDPKENLFEQALRALGRPFRHSHTCSAQKFLSVHVNINVNANISLEAEAQARRVSQTVGGLCFWPTKHEDLGRFMQAACLAASRVSS